MSTSWTRRLAAALTCLWVTVPAAQAQERGFLGYGMLSSNDALADGEDRWQTFSLSASFLYGPKGLTDPPARLGSLWELRSGVQIITPANTVTPAPGDRPVAGVARSELWTHAAQGGWSLGLGAGLEGVGPVTRVIAAQDAFHSLLGAGRVAPGVIAAQVGNRVTPVASATMARAFVLADGITFRPFAEARVGLESYARVGFDMTIGPGDDHGVFGRDYVTGHRYPTLKAGNPTGASAVFGADVARVFSSAFLPAPTTLTPARVRVRGGLLVEQDRFSVFYGMTYLGREFTAQPNGQLVGSLQMRLKF